MVLRARAAPPTGRCLLPGFVSGFFMRQKGDTTVKEHRSINLASFLHIGRNRVLFVPADLVCQSFLVIRKFEKWASVPGPIHKPTAP